MSHFVLDLNKGTIKLGTQRVVLHCNHYNIFLQKVLTDSMDKMKDIQIQVSYELNKKMLEELSADKKIACELFSAIGLGVLDLDSLENGKVIVSNSHYGFVCYYKFGVQNEPVCFFPAGFIAAAAELILGRKVNVTETQCIATNVEENDKCVFEVK